MTYPVSGFDDRTHISTAVKWYDPAKGYGFLVPDDGSPDIYCRAPALAAVGLETLLASAAVACETAQGLRGPEVSRIISVDFSATAPRQASFANAQGNGRMAASPGTDEASSAASGRTVRAIVKWFHPVKGYGFLEPEDGSADVFCHLRGFPHYDYFAGSWSHERRVVARLEATTRGFDARYIVTSLGGEAPRRAELRTFERQRHRSTRVCAGSPAATVSTSPRPQLFDVTKPSFPQL